MARLSRTTRESFRNAARDIEAFARSMKQETGPAARGIGEEVMTDVKASRQGKGVPVDKGTLRSTGVVEGPDRSNLVVLAFGGPAAPYAVEQHERLDYAHDVGEARYLVRGLERWEPGGSQAMRALEANTKQAVLRAGRLSAGGSFDMSPRR